MARLGVQGLIHYVNSTTPFLLASIQDQAGKPVTGLKQDNFKVGIWASLYHISWNALQINSLDVTAAGLGLYAFDLSIINPPQPWSISSDWVFTVHVTTPTDHGQAIASYDACCGKGPRGKA